MDKNFNPNNTMGQKAETPEYDGSSIGENSEGIYVKMGASIADTIIEAIKLSKERNLPVSFELNRIIVEVKTDSIAEAVYRKWLATISSDRTNRYPYNDTHLYGGKEIPNTKK